MPLPAQVQRAETPRDGTAVHDCSTMRVIRHSGGRPPFVMKRSLPAHIPPHEKGGRAQSGQHGGIPLVLSGPLRVGRRHWPGGVFKRHYQQGNRSRPGQLGHGYFLGKTCRMAARPHRCEVTEDPNGPGESDYAGAFEITIAEGDDRSAEEWARSMFERSPIPIRWFVVFGWRFVLGLRLGPRSSPGFVSGWRIREVRPDLIVLDVDSSLLTAQKDIWIASGSVRVSTFVIYKRGLGRAIWASISPVHNRTEPYLLGSAASRRG